MSHLSALPLIALAAGCSTYEPVTPAPGPMVVTSPPVAAPAPSVPVVVAAPSAAAVRPGHGRIESITWLGASSAAAGASQPMRRYRIRMDDGTIQVVDSAAEGFATGDWVELTREGYIRRS